MSDVKCTLCGHLRHRLPKRRVTVYELFCPGDSAPQEAQEAFRKQLADCQYVDEHWGRKAALDHQAIPDIIARRDAALHRGKNLPDKPVTSLSERIADARARTPEAVKFTQADRYIRDADFEVTIDKATGSAEVVVDPNHLTVPGPAPKKRASAKPTNKDPEDYLIHLSEEQ